MRAPTLFDTINFLISILEAELTSQSPQVPSRHAHAICGSLFQLLQLLSWGGWQAMFQSKLRSARTSLELEQKSISTTTQRWPCSQWPREPPRPFVRTPGCTASGTHKYYVLQIAARPGRLLLRSRTPPSGRAPSVARPLGHKMEPHSSSKSRRRARSRFCRALLPQAETNSSSIRGGSTGPGRR